MSTPSIPTLVHVEWPLFLAQLIQQYSMTHQHGPEFSYGRLHTYTQRLCWSRIATTEIEWRHALLVYTTRGNKEELPYSPWYNGQGDRDLQDQNKYIVKLVNVSVKRVTLAVWYIYINACKIYDSFSGRFTHDTIDVLEHTLRTSVDNNQADSFPFVYMLRTDVLQFQLLHIYTMQFLIHIYQPSTLPCHIPHHWYGMMHAW